MMRSRFLAGLSMLAIAAGGALSPAYGQEADPRNDATGATKQANDALLAELPFGDTTDFENAHKGFMYGNLLPPDPKGQIGAGLGTTTSAGTVTLIPPTDIITETGQKEVIDGLTYEFLMAPGSEAPSEMLWFIEEKKAMEAAEDATHTLHNTYSLRGAKIREPLPWSKYLNQALVMWGDKAEVVFAQHHWPTLGQRQRA